MSKKIEDYLHLYLGCKFIYNDGPKVWDGWSGFEKTDTYYYTDEERKHIRMGPHLFQVSKIKLILRPLSDMKEEEKNQISYDSYQMLRTEQGELSLPSKHKSCMWAAKQTAYLLSCGFDLFNLIAEGLALDATQQQP